jgi:hypothetical protein
MPLLFALIAAGCDGSSPAAPVPSENDDPIRIPAGQAPSAGVIEVTTTLDFGDPPFSGRLGITPLDDTPDFHYAVDLDGDGWTDEMGPLGLGVTLAFLFETPGPHQMGIAVYDGAKWLRSDKIVVVNDPGAIQVFDPEIFEELPGAFSGIVFDDARDIIYVATDGVERRDVLALRSAGLKVLWRFSLEATAADPFVGDATALALSADGGTLYVDTGDSIEAVSVTGEPGSLGVVGSGDAGTLLSAADDGILYSGGSNGIARIDVATGRVLARRDAQLGGSFSLSPDGDRVAFLESTHFCRLALLDATDLRSLWTVENLHPAPSDCAFVAYSPRDNVLYVLALALREGWHLIVVDGATGAVLRRMQLTQEDPGSRSPGVSSGSVATEDGRYVAFSTEVGAFFIDARTHLPAYAFLGGVDDLANGCCNITSAPTGFYTTGWNFVRRLSLKP